MDPFELFQDMGIALGLGLLVGLQRQKNETSIAGLRTFALVTMLGTLCSVLSARYGGWILGAGLIATTAITIVSKILKSRSTPDPGMTTEVALILMFGLGAFIAVGSKEVAVVLGGVITILLHFKEQMHGFANRLNKEELHAVMQFVLLSLVILPVLPDRNYGPYSVFNPREIWLMVVLIVGLSLGGYITYKFWGEKAGILLSGILGGIISSTATTVGYSKRAAQNPESNRGAAIIIMIASAIVYIRVLIEITVVDASFLKSAILPIGIMFLTCVVLAWISWFKKGSEAEKMVNQGNPTELRSAFIFAALYAIVLFGIALSRDFLGHGGLYLVAGISGLTDMDAITLSSAKLVKENKISAETGWKLIVVASLSNLVFKAGIVGFLGNRKLFFTICSLFGISMIVGLGLVFYGDLIFPAF